MANLLNVKWEDPSAHSFIPTLLEQKHDGIYVSAFCPLCDKAEESKIEHPSQSSGEAASVAKIRAHIRACHRKAVL